MSHGPEGALIHAPEAWVIEPTRTGAHARAVELWRYRRMLWFLATRTVKERYEGMTLGIFWLFARPLLPILITAFVFGTILRVGSEGVPYIVFFMTGAVPWMLFERSILWGTNCLDQHRGLIQRLYFPRLISPIASIAPAAVDFLIYMGLLAGVALFYFARDGVLYVRFGPSLLLALAVVIFAICCALSVIFWTCIMQTRYRETRFAMRYCLQFWMYLTPVFYPISAVPPEHRWLVYVNPIASIVATFRWAVIGVGELPVVPLLISVVVAAGGMTAGLWFFAASEASTVDRV